MDFFIKTTPLEKVESDLLILFCWQDATIEAANLVKPLSSVISVSAKKERFEGKDGENLTLYTQGKILSYKLLIVGLGKEAEFDLYKLRKSIAKAVKRAMEIKAIKVAIKPHDDWYRNFGVNTVGQAIVEGASLGGYKFLKYKSQEEKKKEENVKDLLILGLPNKISGLEEGVERGKIFSEATVFARDLINEPGSLTTPTFLAETAKEIVRSSKNVIKVRIYEKEELEKMGMGAFLGVSRGSDEPPKFIVLSYKNNRAKGKLVIVGKGITFDTGGLSLKSSEHMETMKLDMSGAAAVLGIFKALIALQPKVAVMGIIAACENMPSGKALKPGDILKALNGKTIEVLNTDAEGRLTFADALSFAARQKPDGIVDLATLTGACMVALGQEIAGLWGNNQKLSEKVKEAALISGEKVWQMPLEGEYKELIKSHIADVKNIQTGRYGGAITAALFLEEFVDDTPWVHLDIAGPAYEEQETAIVPKGGAGFGVRTILQFLLDY